VLNEPGATGVYYDERGKPMLGSAQVRDPRFQDRVVRGDPRPARDHPGPDVMDSEL